ncbi:MAG: hypothetical protein ACHQ4G_05545 [Opitutales bacterium]
MHQKLLAMRDLGLTRISALGGLGPMAQTPYWPNPAVLRAAQFTPAVAIDEVLRATAREFVGERHASALVAGWDAFEEALSWQPPVYLFSGFGFCWQRTFDRPFVPDIEAIPAKERAYYERFGCFQHNNPSLNDLGKDVLFDLVTRAQGARAMHCFDRHVFPRLAKLIARLEKLETQTAAEPAAQAVFADLLDRARAFRVWCGSLRMVCAWCAHVYGYLESKNAAAKRQHVSYLQAAIDEELVNTANLLDLLERGRTEVMVLSAVGNNTFCYGEDLPILLRQKIRLMKKYRHHPPRIDRDILWRPVPGAVWPTFD